MAFYLDGLFVCAEERRRDGKSDGYNMLVANGADAHKVKISDGVYRNCKVDTLTLGTRICCPVKVNVFRDKAYFTAEDVQVVTEG